MEEVSEPITAEELREFLAADLTGAPAAPAFRRRLRSRLWKLVKARARQRRAARTAARADASREPSVAPPRLP